MLKTYFHWCFCKFPIEFVFTFQMHLRVRICWNISHICLNIKLKQMSFFSTVINWKSFNKCWNLTFPPVCLTECQITLVLKPSIKSILAIYHWIQYVKVSGEHTQTSILTCTNLHVWQSMIYWKWQYIQYKHHHSSETSVIWYACPYLVNSDETTINKQQKFSEFLIKMNNVLLITTFLSIPPNILMYFN